MMSNNIPQNTVEVSSVYTYKELSIDKLKYEYEITVGSDYIKQKVNSRLQEIAENAKSPGFRAGKMPYDLVVANYKNEALEYVINNTIDYCSSDLMKKLKSSLTFILRLMLYHYQIWAKKMRRAILYTSYLLSRCLKYR